MEIIFGLLIWLGIVLVSALVFIVLGKKYFSLVQGWESRETLSAVTWGLIAIVLSSAAFFFLPLVALSMFSSNLKDAGNEILSVASGSGISARLGMFSRKILASMGYAVIAYVGGAVISLALLVWGILLQIREKQKKATDESDRKKLFSFKEDELDKINGK